MKTTARDVMTRRYYTLSPHQTVAEAVRLFKTATRVEGRIKVEASG